MQKNSITMNTMKIRYPGILSIIILCGICILSIPVASHGNVPVSGSYSPGMHSVDIKGLKPLSEADSVVAGAIYADVSAPAADRAADLIRRMTFEEKLALTGGWNRFMVSGVERLGIRPVSMADASQGIRMQTTVIKGESTSFPGMLPMASTWNVGLIQEMAGCLAEECRAFGVDMLLGPGANIQRLSVGGRNFEYFGEDPYLTSEMAAAYVGALQKGGIIAVPKHFVGNDQDFCRHIANSVIDERTLREIYLLPWEKMMTEAGCLGMMTGNNLVNGLPCPMNKPLIDDILRKEYGFTGVAMTDWQNTCYYPGLQNLVLTSGETLLMPDNKAFSKYVTEEIALSEERKAEVEILLERMIFPTLYTLFKTGVYDRPLSVPANLGTFGRHKAVAAECATEAMVLLKNKDRILPLKPGQRILLTGTEEIHSGTGSGFVSGYDHVSFEDGLKAVFGEDLVCDTAPDDDAVRSADVVLFRLNKSGGEGKDIPYGEPVDQLEQLSRVIGLNKNVVVLISSCNVMPMDWLDKVKGVVWCYFLGQERGTALAGLLSGAENFSGKLPFTVEKDFSDSPDPDFNYIDGKPYWDGNNQYKNYWLGIKDKPVKGFSDFISPGETIDVPYSEGLYVGYRWYDKHDIPVHFPFGFGLSYTSFKYESVNCVDRMSEEGKVYVDVTVRNTGKVAGKEVIQLYVSDPECRVERPEKELKAFAKVGLLPGEGKTVRLELDARSFSYWDEDHDAWKMEPGEYEILAGGSSADLPLSCSLDVRGTRFAVLTDTHIGRGDSDVKLKKAVQSINSNPEIGFVLVLGDISDHGTEEELVYAREILSGLEVPYYFTTGNHDARWPDRREAFKKVFGTDRYSFESGGVRFIGFSTGPFETVKRASVRQEDLEWIKSETSGDSPVVVGVHYTPDLIYNEEAVDEAFGDANIVLWLAGHLRYNKVRSEDPYPALIDVSSQEGSSYNIVDVAGNTVNVYVVTPEDGKDTLWYSFPR